MSESCTATLARFAVETSAAHLPARVRSATRRLLLDTLGCCVGGVAVPSSAAVSAVQAARGGIGQATVLVDGARTSALSATHINAHRANALDAEETIRHSGHLAAATVPPALAIAEFVGATGEDFLAAVAVGFDAGARVALSLRTLDTTPDGRTIISPVASSSWAAIAACTAAGRLLGFDVDRMIMAFGLTVACAPTPIAGRWGRLAAPRPMTKYGLYGVIAEAGVTGALLADRGMEAEDAILDGPDGFWRMSGSARSDWEALTSALGERWLVEETSYKLFPACQWAMPALDLLYRIAEEEQLDLSAAERVEVLVPQAALTKHMASRDVRTVVDGQFSIPHLVALAAVGGPPGPGWHTEAALRDARVAAFAEKVVVDVYDRAGPILAELMTRQGHAHLIPTQVTVRIDGRDIVRTSNLSESDQLDHHVTDEALRLKFRRFCEPFLSSDRIDAAESAVAEIDTAASVGRLVAALTATEA